MDIEPLKESSNKIGIDVGIKDFANLSNGEVIENPKYLEKLEKRLKTLQRRLSSKKKGSQNYKKAKLKIAKLHERITNLRNDFLHKLSIRLIRENQIICLEDLKVKNMIKNHHLAKSIASVSWYKFKQFLTYKALWYGRTVQLVGTFYASSKTCNTCGYKLKNLKLSTRAWTCPECGIVHHRDQNAAINILNEGLKLLNA